MKSDIIERLKSFSTAWRSDGQTPLNFALDEAVAEIERLRAEVVEWKKAAGKYAAGCDLCAPTAEALEQALDDMGAAGLCVCQETKEMMQAALPSAHEQTKAGNDG